MTSPGEVELESAAPGLLEELRKRSSLAKSTRERMPTLLSHRVVRVLPIVKALPKFWRARSAYIGPVSEKHNRKK